MRAGLKALLATVLLLAISSSAYSQFNGEENTIFVTGQVTNTVNGAPVSNHKIYIESDSVSNSGFQFYSTIYTDVNGFYYDTVKTTNNDGNLNIYLYDFEEDLHEATKYYRFNWSDKYNVVADFFIHDPSANSTYQANFDAVEDTSETHPLRVHFNDESLGFVIKSWYWDFGDGTTSDIQDPVHDFPAPGRYLVTLTISSVPLVNETNKISRITKQVFVGLPDYYNMGGHVFTEYFPIDVGLAYLYIMNDEGQPVPVDTTSIDTLGYYWFYQVIEGQYMVKARLAKESQAYGNFIPTYYGNRFNWEEAKAFTLDAHNFGLHIDLIPSEGTKMGSGQITGQIVYDTNTVTTDLTPAEDIEIILLNGSSICLTCNLSDLEGFFRFGELEYGTYQVYPDVTGIRAEPMFITLSEDIPGDFPFNLIISRNLITFGIEDDPVIAENSISLWPNPARERATFSLELEEPADISFYIADQRGKIVMEQSVALSRGKQTVGIDLGNMSPGLYYLVATSGNGKPAAARIIKL